VKFEVSVIIPTHNPRLDYLERVIQGLKAQTLERERWELVVVDNKSEEPLRLFEGGKVGRWGSVAGGGSLVAGETGGQKTEDGGRVAGGGSLVAGGDPSSISHLPSPLNARVVREEKLGLTNARLRGFAETTGEIVVLVDDDNVLAPNYLEEVVRIGKEHPQLGTWSGAIELVLEPGSPEPAEKLRHLLCERRVERAVWSNDRSHFAATPWGAGECIRRKVVEAYAAKVAREPRRRQLDLQGKDLVYGGDTDIAYTGCELGYAMGVFPELKLKHLTPPTRCTEEYLHKTFEARAYSEVLHGWIETGKIPKQRTDVRGRLAVLARYVFGSSLEKRMIQARSRGLKRAEEFVSFQSKVNQA